MHPISVAETPEEKYKRGAEIASREIHNHIRLLYWWDRRLCKWTNQKFGCHVQHGEFIGLIYMLYARCWASYDENRSAAKGVGREQGFGAYFRQSMMNIKSIVLRKWFKYESESWYRFVVFDEDLDGTLSRQCHQNFSYHEADFYHYRIPDRDDEWTADIIDELGGPKAAWDYLFADLQDRENRILSRRIRFSHTLDEIGRDEGITKERVRQIQNKAGERLISKLKADQAFTALFDDRPDLQWNPKAL